MHELEDVLDEGVNLGPACLPSLPRDVMVVGIPTSRITVFDASSSHFDAQRRRSSANQTCRRSPRERLEAETVPRCARCLSPPERRAFRSMVQAPSCSA
jgi:hypothetical protein